MEGAEDGVSTFAVGFAPGPFLLGAPPAMAVPAALTDQDLAVLVGLLRAATETQQAVLVLYPTWLTERAQHRLHLVAAAVGRDRVVLRSSRLPPLAGAVLVSLACALWARLRPGAACSALTLVEGDLQLFTWLSSLGGLKDPPPSVGQHLVSLLPSTAFGVSTYPQPAVWRLRGPDDGVPVPRLPPGWALAVAATDMDRGWAQRTLVPHLGHPLVVEVDAPPDSARWWGCRRLVEAVAYPLDPMSQAKGTVTARCGWCGEPGDAEVCTVCGSAVRQTAVGVGVGLAP